MRSAGKTATTALLVAYPIAVWVGISTLGIRAAGWTVLAALVITIAVDLRRPGAMPSLLGRFGLAAMAGLGILLDEERFLLVIPVLINATLLVVFGYSLVGGRMTMVERFARLMAGDPSARKIAYCRSVTIVWCGFFLANGLITLWLVMFGSLVAWGVYTGMIAYMLMGTLFAGEYVVRRIRFG